MAGVMIFSLLLAVPTRHARADSAGYALAFDGVNDLVRLTYTASIMGTSTWTTTKTVELWVKPEGSPVSCANNVVAACDYIFGDRPEWWGITRGIINGQDRIWIFNFDGNMDQIGLAYTAGAWVHIAMVHNNGVLRAYVNGVELAAVASGATRQPSTGALPKLYIGGVIFNASRNYTMQGQIDEVRIWNTGRTPPRSWPTRTIVSPAARPVWRLITRCPMGPARSCPMTASTIGMGHCSTAMCPSRRMAHTRSGSPRAHLANPHQHRPSRR